MTAERNDRAAAAKVRATLLGALGDISGRKLTADQWSSLAQIIEVAISAESSADLDGLRQAVTELELTGRVRIVKIGGGPVAPAPAPVRERVEVLRATLRAEAKAASTEPGKDKK
jgi:hypothetical protein